MTMLCIDASTSNFGLAWFLYGRLYEVRNIYLEGKFDLEKMHKLYEVFDPILNINVDFVVFEQPVPMMQSRAVTSINQAIGILFGICFARNISVDWIHNRTVKSRMGVNLKGKEGKKQAIQIVQQLHPFLAPAITTDHIADAVLVGEAYKQVIQEII